MIIDTHHHWMPQEHIDKAEKFMRPNEKAVRDGDKVRLFRNDIEVFTVLPTYPDIKAHLQAMDAAGVDMAVFSTGLWQEWNTMKIAPFVNDTLAEIQRQYPDRIIGLAHVPPFERGAAGELERAIKVLGLKGVCITSHCQGRYPDDDGYRPLYKKAVELDVPIVVHAAGAPADYEFLRKYSLTRNFGRAIDHTLVTIKLLYSGILQDYPTLKFLNGHTGGTWWALGERFLSPTGHFWRKEDLPQHDVKKFIKQIYFDTAARLTEPEVTCAAATIGVDYLMAGSDYPAGPLDCLERSVKLINSLALPKKDKGKIFSGNAAKLFKVKT